MAGYTLRGALEAFMTYSEGWGDEGLESLRADIAASIASGSGQDLLRCVKSADSWLAELDGQDDPMTGIAEVRAILGSSR